MNNSTGSLACSMPDTGLFKQKHKGLLILISGLFLFCHGLKAQESDSVKSSSKVSQDSAKVVQSSALSDGGDSARKSKIKVHSPAKAMLYSAICPGLGQIYNRRYWKLPIIYVGIGTMVYFIVTNQQMYNSYQAALVTRTNGGIDPYYNIYSTSDLVSERDFYHEYRDLSVIGAAFLYALNVIDAEVDAQLFTFDVSDDISMRFTPQIMPVCSNLAIAPGMTFVMHIK